MRCKKVFFTSLITLLAFAAFTLPKIIAKSFIQPDLTVVGFIHLKDGLGRQSAEIIDAFRNDLKVNFVPTRKRKTSDIPKRFHSLVKQKSPKWGKVILFEEMLWWPKEEKYRAILSSDREKSIRIAYLMWESTKLPNEWVEILNKHFDAAVVPSKFLIDTFHNSGVNIPVFELPLGLNLDCFLQEPLKREAGTPFTFGNLSVCSERKNQVQLIRAFAKAFGNDPTVRLRINCRYGEKEVSAAITHEIAKLNLDNVIFTQFSLSPDEYLELFKTIDCYVSPSKGEGFSIQPREAMALGIPVIATNNTGQADICASNLVKVVNSSEKEVALFPWGNSYGHYFNCDVDELSELLLKMKNYYSEYLQQANDSRNWVKQFCYENLKQNYKALIKPSLVQLASENKIEGDIVYTKSLDLLQKYKRKNN